MTNLFIQNEVWSAMCVYCRIELCIYKLFFQWINIVDNIALMNSGTVL